jgi:hypothetical protein
VPEAVDAAESGVGEVQALEPVELHARAQPLEAYACVRSFIIHVSWRGSST